MQKETVVNSVTSVMASVLNMEQLNLLKETMYIALKGYSIKKEETAIEVSQNANEYLFTLFIQSKLTSGSLSEKSIRSYSYCMRDFFEKIPKQVTDITTEDIRIYLAFSHKNKDGSLKKSASMNTIYHILNSFFGWLEDNEYIPRNPMAKISPYKMKKQVKKPFTEEELAALKDACDDLRDLAIIDLLNSSMIRVGELVKLDRSDISFVTKEFTVIGKGNKERVARFDGQTAFHLKQYLDSREDDNPALFISKRGSNRLAERGVQELLKEIGEKSGVTDVHPHRFRRTGATRCLRANVPIEVIQHMLGHSNISTTQIYASSNESSASHYYRQVYND